MSRLGTLGMIVLALAVAGCSSTNPPPARTDAPVRTRCLNDRTETTSRPIIFLFCVESP